VMIGKPWSWSICPTAMSTVMQIKPTRAIRALEGLKVMALSVRVGSGRAVGRSVRSQHHIRHIELLQGHRKSCS